MSGSDHLLDGLLAAARAALSHLHLPFTGSNPNPNPSPTTLTSIFLELESAPFTTTTPTWRCTQHPKHPPPHHLLLCIGIAFHNLLDNHHLHQFHTLPTLIHANKHAFLSNLPFAKLKVAPPPQPSATPTPAQTGDKEDTDTAANHSPPSTLPVRLLNSPVDRLRSTLSTLSLTDLIDLFKQSLSYK
uniref:Uncharacterized protein n=1 Tax=Oryza meridionalis TaxID=40149 RepID=A0A0E0D9D1_9ORYZ